MAIMAASWDFLFSVIFMVFLLWILLIYPGSCASTASDDLFIVTFHCSSHYWCLDLAIFQVFIVDHPYSISVPIHIILLIPFICSPSMYCTGHSNWNCLAIFNVMLCSLLLHFYSFDTTLYWFFLIYLSCHLWYLVISIDDPLLQQLSYFPISHHLCRHCCIYMDIVDLSLWMFPCYSVIHHCFNFHHAYYIDIWGSREQNQQGIFWGGGGVLFCGPVDVSQEWRHVDQKIDFELWRCYSVITFK